MKVKVKKLHKDAILPVYATEGAACFDLHACTGALTYRVSIDPVKIGTCLAFEIPEGHVMLVFSRSGHGFKHDVRLANCVGVIDSDYRGELMVKLTKDSFGNEFVVQHGDRIAQAMVIPAKQVEFVEADNLSDTERGTGGFGSTGK